MIHGSSVIGHNGKTMFTLKTLLRKMKIKSQRSNHSFQGAMMTESEAWTGIPLGHFTEKGVLCIQPWCLATVMSP